LLDLRSGAAALARGVAVVAATTGVHRRHQIETGGKSRVAAKRPLPSFPQGGPHVPF
jgi:hypothetical protein